MATELAMAMRRLKAQEATARQVADLSRKLDLVMAHLGIVDAPAAAVETAPVEESPADAKAEAETVPPTLMRKPTQRQSPLMPET